jgi:hypothetical protein
MDRLCGLEVPGSSPAPTSFFHVAMGLERCPLNLVRINEELTE